MHRKWESGNVKCAAFNVCMCLYRTHSGASRTPPIYISIVRCVCIYVHIDTASHTAYDRMFCRLVKNFRFSFSGWFKKHAEEIGRLRYSYNSDEIDGNRSSSSSNSNHISNFFLLSGLTSQCLPKPKQSNCYFHFSWLCYVWCSSSSFVRVKHK